MKKITLGLIILIISNLYAYTQQVTPFRDGDRAVFLGNSITDGGHYHSYIWLYYMTRFPDMKLSILNAGIGGDRAPDMYKRLDGDVFSKRPTVLITTFGMNDSGYMEYNAPDADKFADRMVKECYESYQLIEKRFKTLPNTKIVLLGSSPYDETAHIEGNIILKNKNKAMLRIIDFQKESATKNQWEFVDFNRPMIEINKKFQLNDPSFTLCGNDRVHPDNDGHMVMAYLFLKAQGFSEKEVANIELNAAKNTVNLSSNCTISNIKNINSEISFDYLAQSLPYPLDTLPRGWGSKKSQAQINEVLPFTDEMNKEILKITGLKGKYKLLIDNEEIGIWSDKDFAKGINLACQSKTPQYQQALSIMYLNEERWEIERRFREYAWIQFCFFQERGLLFADNREAIKIMDAEIPKNGWLASRRDIYSKIMFPEIRDAWQQEMNLLVSKIYEINKPIMRKISIVRLK